MEKQTTSKVSSGKKKKKAKKVEGPWKKRFLFGALGGSIMASILWMIAFSINYWVHWVLPEDGLFRQNSNTYLETQYGGMWKLCRTERRNDTEDRTVECSRLNLFPSNEELQKDLETDQNVLNYRRSIAALGIIGIFIMVIANLFSYYSILEPRYVYKRLAGCLQIGCAGCILVCVEIFDGLVEYEKTNLPVKYPPTTYHTFGFCYGLAWFCFALFLLTSIILFVYSRKRKDDVAHDRPVIIGRV